jgi:hypothetical protein
MNLFSTISLSVFLFSKSKKVKTLFSMFISEQCFHLFFQVFYFLFFIFFVCKLFFISKIWFLKRYYNKNYLINWKKSFSLINFEFSISSTDWIVFSFLRPWSGRSPSRLSQWKETPTTYWNGRRGESLTMFFHTLVHLLLNKASLFVIIIIIIITII